MQGGNEPGRPLSEGLFARAASRDKRGQPLAERMRPASLDDYIGQSQILGEGRWLRRALDQGRLSSMVLWGPPGTGKTSLGRLLAAEVKAVFVALSAVMSGVKDLRSEVAAAQARLQRYGERTLLFVDEIHRFNKSQQDALLPHVEAGTVIFVGATTENPSFEVNAALLSRCRVLVLNPLSADNIRALICRALEDPQRGIMAGTTGETKVVCPEPVMDALVAGARGDARRALTALEAAAEIPRPDEDGVVTLDTYAIEEALQKKVLLYDKGGDQHYEVVSAFIKSLRGSDPDAAVYWMARMIEAGEDPLFVLRRLVIFAAEDIGVADPNALVVANAAREAFTFVGMPEGVLPMTQAALYLARAPKSNTALSTYKAARGLIKKSGLLPVPKHLRNAATDLQRDLGFGEGYRYPHDHPDAKVGQDYLPTALLKAYHQGSRLYVPTGNGAESEVWGSARNGCGASDEKKK